jgi:hypothetical protein
VNHGYLSAGAMQIRRTLSSSSSSDKPSSVSIIPKQNIQQIDTNIILKNEISENKKVTEEKNNDI